MCCRVPGVALPDHPHVGREPPGRVDAAGGDEGRQPVRTRRTSRVETGSARHPERLHLQTQRGTTGTKQKKDFFRHVAPPIFDSLHYVHPFLSSFTMSPLYSVSFANLLGYSVNRLISS